METGLSFSDKENKCRQLFAGTGQFWHVSTPEDFEVIFRTDDDFSIGMSIVAICSMLFPNVKIITFILMNNHIHLVLQGEYDDVIGLFECIKKYLFRYFSKRGRTFNYESFSPSIIEVKDIEYLRNAIAYDNRNAYVVNPNCTPMTYKWGAGKYFFNPDAKRRYEESGKVLTVRQIRNLCFSQKFDKVIGITMVDGFACPMSFCDIHLGESIFRNDAHYFNKISKSVESSKNIANEIGERIWYTDDELYSIIVSQAKSKNGATPINMLPASEKIELAKRMHFDYNATNKQIQRMLRLEETIVSNMFPKHQ